ncbi:MAG: S8 family serine peptidase [Pseudomonadota bacterium]|nr:S8 family serine peptidase [Burkholderiaceae bacterium]MDQ3447036.1 S8 family serine peptidase [Pseudomonadota bacterium]
MNRQLLGLTGAFVASVAVALPSSTANSTRVTAKQAALKGIPAVSNAAPEQMVSRLIVKLRSPTASELVRPMSASRVQALSATAGVGMKSVRPMAGNASLLVLDTPLHLSEARAVAARLARDSGVEYAEPDIMFKKVATPNDPRFSEMQWNLFAPSATYTGALTPAAGGGTRSATATGGANLPLAWDVTTGHNSVVLAVIDTGIVNHTDLNNAGVTPFSETYVPNGRFLAGYDFISEGAGGLPTNFVANDGNGRDPDPSDPGDFVTTQDEMAHPLVCDDGQPGPQNSSWHGSHMAGVAAAMTNNALSIASVAWNVRVLPVRALGKCGGALSDIAEAIHWAAGLPVPGVPTNTTPAQVISLSLGSDPDVPCDGTMQSAVNAAIASGAVVVAATGNDFRPDAISVPAKCTGVIAVTAHTINGENADYSNIGAAGGAPPQPTISSPGGGQPTLLGRGGPTDEPSWFGYYIWSTTLWGNTTPSSGGGPGGASTGPNLSGFTGTSAATPQVAAVAALIKSMIPSASPTMIRNFLVTTVRPHPAGGACALPPPMGFMGQCGPGLLDANAAVRAAALVAPPVVIVQPQNTTVFEGQTATFSVAATGAGPIAYQWRRNGTPIAGATSASYTTPAVTIAADNGSTYSVVITNGAGTVTTSAATLAVAPPPPPPPVGGGGGGGSLPFWQLLLLAALSLAARVRASDRTQ